MGRKALLTTEIVEHQMEAWAWIDRAREKLREAWLEMDRELYEAERELLVADGLVELLVADGLVEGVTDESTKDARRSEG